LLFVSHDIISVQNLCANALVLNKGKPAFWGLPSEAATRYFALAASEAAPSTTAVAAPREAPPPAVEEIERLNILPQARSRYGTQRVIVRAATIVTPLGANILGAAVNESIKILFLLEALVDVRAVSFGVHLHDRMGELVFAAGARNCGATLHHLAAGEKLLASYELHLSVAPGEYTLSVGCSAYSDPTDDGPNVGVVDDRHEGIGPLNISWPTEKILPFYGKAALNVQIHYHELSKDLPADLLRYQPRTVGNSLYH
ncbi:MAG TPA: Wzt carbohydrate-binding domain-containing protein, partial [Candidatus Didemnitutus sp.]|nr:Wzt carbohydrate-binding domain-containing protein [Candidatus Didemnitutus sp.]